MNSVTVEIPFSGHSMDPIFKNTSSVWVDFSEELKVDVGDVLLYRDPTNEWVCHRLICVDKNGYWLKGDANTQSELIQDLQSWGRVSSIQRGERRIVLRKTLLIRWLCFFQKMQIVSKTWFFKKFYRSLTKALLSFETFFSN
jgi:hypothetical protein